MKKVKWIFSINADGVYPLGYTSIFNGLWVPGQISKFQKELKASLPPEIELEFLSYNTNQPETLRADLVLYNELDKKYLDEKTIKQALNIPYNLIYAPNIEAIKAFIEANV
jgi:CRISPR/Cas system CMR subunit Cmr4 (Cas7 group RAMP superfamily)